MGSGEDQEIFVLHEHLLRQNSAFFEKALSGAWKETQEGTVKMPETSKKTFAVFARFNLTGWLFIREENEVVPGSSSEADGIQKESLRTEAIMICRLQELAHFLQAPDFQDAATDALIETVSEMRRVKSMRVAGFSGSYVASIYKHSTLNSPVRRLIVEICLHRWGKKRLLTTEFETYPHRFCHDYIIAAAARITSARNVKDDTDPLDIRYSCKYHEHARDRKPCYKEKFQYSTQQAKVSYGTSVNNTYDACLTFTGQGTSVKVATESITENEEPEL